MSFSRDRKLSLYPVEYCLESVEKYSEGKSEIQKSEPEVRNANVNTTFPFGLIKKRKFRCNPEETVNDLMIYR